MHGLRRRTVSASVAALLTWPLAGVSASANINLELRPASQTVTIGVDEEFGVGLYAVSDDDTDQLFAAIQAVISWEPEFVQLLGLDPTGGAPLILSGFPVNRPSGLNESDPPQDGDGIYIAWAPLGDPIAATPEGTLVTTFVFEPVSPTPATAIDILESAGDPPEDTIVFDGEIENLDVTGTLTGATIEVEPCCPPDFNGDCVVNVQDFLILLGAWGTDPGGPPDLDGDGVVAVNDFLLLLAAWGPCP